MRLQAHTFPYPPRKAPQVVRAHPNLDDTQLQLRDCYGCGERFLFRAGEVWCYKCVGRDVGLDAQATNLQCYFCNQEETLISKRPNKCLSCAGFNETDGRVPVCGMCGCLGRAPGDSVCVVCRSELQLARVETAEATVAKEARKFINIRELADAVKAYYGK
jgi:hypothetical protein